MPGPWEVSMWQLGFAMEWWSTRGGTGIRGSHMEVSINGDNAKWMVYIGRLYQNGWEFGVPGVPPFMETTSWHYAKKEIDGNSVDQFAAQPYRNTKDP